MAGKQLVGTVVHFFPKIGVAIVTLTAELSVGDNVAVEGHGEGFEQKVESMQMEHAEVKSARSGDSVGIKASQAVREGAKVYKIV